VGRLRILFRVAAGPRVGFGHLIRATRLAETFDARAWISVRGGPTIPTPSRTLKRVTGGVAQMDRLRPDVLILDTPVQSDARRWVAAARSRNIPIVSVHDRGIAPVASDLAIDGSVAARRPIQGAARTLIGARYAVIDRRVTNSQAAGRKGQSHILVALGGGTRARVAARLSAAIAARLPQTHVVVAGGFLSRTRTIAANVEWLGPQDGLGHLFATSHVAVVAGGLTLYESSAARVPVVPVAVVPAQVPAIRAFANYGAALDPQVTLRGRHIDASAVDRVVRAVALLASNPHRRSDLSRAGRRLVDGRGAARVAGQVLRVIARHRRAA
jgi:UDP-2,4-diacetamido-2,4,6-trideoxy-beta-L-altropyranose hydrolase